MKENNIRIISRLTSLSFLGLIISIGVVINKLITMEYVASIPYQMPFVFFAFSFFGLLILVIDEDKKQLVDDR